MNKTSPVAAPLTLPDMPQRMRVEGNALVGWALCNRVDGNVVAYSDYSALRAVAKEAIERAEAAEAQVAALKEYARHKYTCQLLDANEERTDCTCGLAAASSEKEGKK